MGGVSSVGECGGDVCGGNGSECDCAGGVKDDIKTIRKDFPSQVVVFEGWITGVSG